MARFLTTIFPNQEIPPVSTEGLPFWLFWLMLCIILLLIAFIFLRNKDMRRRIDSFFVAFRKKIKRTRLQQILKREQRRIENTLFELGKKAWSHDIKIPDSEPLSKKIIDIDHKIEELMEEKKQSASEIKTLNNDLQELKEKQDQRSQQIKNKISVKNQERQTLQDKEKEAENAITQKHFVMESTTNKITQAKKELLDLESDETLNENEKKTKKEDLEEKIKKWEQKKKKSNEQIKKLVKDETDTENKIKQLSKETESLNQRLKEIEHSKKQETKKFQKEIHEWEKTRDKIAEKINKREEDKAPFYKNLGKLANEQRIKHKELSIYYSKTDRSEKRIKNLKKQIELET
ncbi:MAG: hypothetical protein ACOC5G_03335 [Acidobacteriota bacterium]